MTASTPVERVAEILAGAGYRRVATPLEIAGLKFELPTAFVGTSPSPDLIIVADTAFEDELRILRKIESIARAMDVVRSKRPLTAVLAGPRPSSATIDSMSRVCRVLPIGTIRTKTLTRIAELVGCPHATELAGAKYKYRRSLDGNCGAARGASAEVAGLVDFAQQGADAVQARLHEIISEPLAEEDVGDEP